MLRCYGFIGIICWRLRKVRKVASKEKPGQGCGLISWCPEDERILERNTFLEEPMEPYIVRPSLARSCPAATWDLTEVVSIRKSLATCETGKMSIKKRPTVTPKFKDSTYTTLDLGWSLETGLEYSWF